MSCGLRTWTSVQAETSASRSTVPRAATNVAEHPAAPLLVLGALLLADALVLLATQRGMTFLVDEWLILSGRRQWTIEAFLDPFYEHLFIFPTAVFKVLMSATGIGPHVLYALPMIALHLTSVVLVYVLARRRIGPWFALAPAAAILFLGSSYDNNLLPIQVSFLGSIAAGLGMLLALDSVASRRVDVLASVLLAVSLSSSSLGIIFAIAAVVELVVQRELRRRGWLVLAPLVLYGIWYAVYGPRGLEQGGSLTENAKLTPEFMADAAAAALAAIMGLGFDWGRPLLVLAVVLVAYRLVTRGAFSPRFTALLVSVVSFWALGGLARAHQENPGASRYLYPAAVLVVLLVVEALRFTRLDRRWAAFLLLFITFASVGNANILRGARDTHRAFSREVLAQFAAIELLGRENVPSELIAAPYLAPQITAQQYFELTDALGSPVDVTRDLVEAGERQRRDGDVVLVAAIRALTVEAARSTTRARPPVVEAAGGQTSAEGPCVRFDPMRPRGRMIVAATRSLVVRAGQTGSVEVGLRRFHSDFRRVARVRAGRSLALPLSEDGIATPWRLEVGAVDTVSVCTARLPRAG